MGGPLGHSHSTAGGWSRDLTYGRIQGYYTPTSDFRPARISWPEQSALAVALRLSGN
jgi:hypothetical protein